MYLGEVLQGEIDAWLSCVHVQGLFEAIFSHWPLHWVFADSSGGLREWWFRVQLDRHVSGMETVPWNAYILLLQKD